MTGTVGATVGVEEEYHLVDATTGGLADAPAVVATAKGLLGDDAQSEISTSQLEVATPVCTSLADVRRQLVRLRRGAAQAAEAHGCRVLACGTHPSGSWLEQRLTEGERYLEVYERLGLLALQQLIAGCHVHVGMSSSGEPDAELGVRVLDRLRPDLHLLLALSGSSPFWEGVDTSYASYRTQWFNRFPVTGTAQLVGDRATYDRLVADLVATGMVRDASHLYWDARLSTRFPTVEVRIADTCPVVDDVVLQAALVRSLVRVAADEAVRDVPFARPRSELVRAARWRAARFGVTGQLVDLRAGGLAEGAALLDAALIRLRPDLEELGDWDEVRELADALLARGTSAQRQRDVFVRTGELSEVVQAVVRESAAA
ncbi:MAG: glutamate--cysteine ligase [Actinomycetes bacterium]